MKKLSLNLDELKVESFETEESKNEKGTVNGQAWSVGATNCGENTCEGDSCDGTCYETCAYTCGNTCGGEETCDYTCADTCGFKVTCSPMCLTQ